MKNKKLYYILIPGTILVWGMIMQKIFSAVSGKEETLSLQTMPVPAQEHSVYADTFSIHSGYPDPFRAHSPKKVSAHAGNTITPKKEVKKAIPPASQPWPAIVYGGIIKNQKSSKQLTLVQVNGQSNIMNVGDIAEDVQLLKVSKDSIQVKFGKEIKYIGK